MTVIKMYENNTFVQVTSNYYLSLFNKIIVKDMYKIVACITSCDTLAHDVYIAMLCKTVACVTCNILAW